jgi:hypothetical protein
MAAAGGGGRVDALNGRPTADDLRVDVTIER